jgi:hypothetical protein
MITWPTPSDYHVAIQNPGTVFADPHLRTAQPALDRLGLPKVASGNYCSVYELRDGQRRWAVRCFNRQVPDAQHRYRIIDEHLDCHSLPWLVGFDFLEQGIRIQGRWYPIVTMDWVEGATLTGYLEKQVRDSAAVRALADQWPQVMADLRAAGIAHGDLQHGNVLVSQGAFRLVDYDSLFVPALRGERSPDLGHHHYQHLDRTADTFDLNVGDFAAIVIYLSLRALAVDPSLWRYHCGENLILTADDYKHPSTSPALAQMRASPDQTVRQLAEQLVRCIALPVSQVPSLHVVLASIGTAASSHATPSAPGPPRSSGTPGWLSPPTPVLGSSTPGSATTSATLLNSTNVLRPKHGRALGVIAQLGTGCATVRVSSPSSTK